MKFRGLLYVKEELAAEPELLEWMAEEAGGCGVRCVDVGEIARTADRQKTENACALRNLERGARLAAAIAGEGLCAEDSLAIVTTEAEWALAKGLGIAALPYVPKLSARAPHFPGAWIIAEGFGDVEYDFLNKCYQRAHHLPWEILATGRCVLRELSMDDMDALFALYEQPGVTDYMEGLYERTKEERYEQAYIDNMYRYYGYGMWLVCSKQTGEVIGRAGLEHRDYDGVTELEMGYMIAPKEQRRGLATEVCRALVEYARENLDFDRINCLIRADHMVSKHLVERLGFTFFEKMDINGVEMERYTYCFSAENRI